MKKSYIIFWSVITIVIIASIIGATAYLKNHLKPIKQTVETAQLVAKITTQPQKITASDMQNIANAIIDMINPAVSNIPQTPKDTTLKMPSQMIFVGINKILDVKTPFNTEIEYMRQIKRSDFYIVTGVEIPIKKDSILQGSKIKLGLVWRR